MREKLRIKASERAPEDIPPATDILDEGVGGIPEKDPPSSSKDRKRMTMMKVIVWVCLINGLAWVWCSYILAWLGRETIAESLSQVALTEIIGVVLVYGLKSLIENLSKNNSWPDKKKTNADDASSDGLG